MRTPATKSAANAPWFPHSGRHRGAGAHGACHAAGPSAPKLSRGVSLHPSPQATPGAPTTTLLASSAVVVLVAWALASVAPFARWATLLDGLQWTIADGVA